MENYLTARMKMASWLSILSPLLLQLGRRSTYLNNKPVLIFEKGKSHRGDI
jgi:hypothetical protein